MSSRRQGIKKLDTSKKNDNDDYDDEIIINTIIASIVRCQQKLHPEYIVCISNRMPGAKPFIRLSHYVGDFYVLKGIGSDLHVRDVSTKWLAEHRLIK